ncbi:MAG: phasin family protein [Geminicoccaceae bacterium]|nr:phasin family protein [Geminicoccaceae bacterium]
MSDSKSPFDAANYATAMPKLDVEAMFAMQRANIETLVAVQKIFFDLAQTMARRQSEMMKDAFDRGQAMMKTQDGKSKPADYMDEARVAMEKAVADAKETLDLGLKAQNEAVDLVVKRAAKNFDEAKQISG